MGDLLTVRNLNIGFRTDSGLTPAVDGFDMDIDRGQSLALVGESACGKSVSALSLMRLLESPPAVVSADAMVFDGQEMQNLGEEDLLKIRGNRMSMIYQEPMTSLNPIMSIGAQLAEPIRLHNRIGKKEASEQVIRLLESVGIPDAARQLRAYPHQFSGGMRQRAMIAMAIACRPELLIADEPTTALDVTIQAQILSLLNELRRELNMSLLLITHNMGVVAQNADLVAVMYAGQIVEQMTADTAFTHPFHPYTHGLLNSIPRVNVKKERLESLEGTVPSPMFYPKGCRFAPRCPFRKEVCAASAPPLAEVSDNHRVRCFAPLSDERGVLE